MGVTLGDFQPINRWKLDQDGEKYDCCIEHRGLPIFLVDQTTNRRYLNESKKLVGFKCVLLTLGTPLVHVAVSLRDTALRIIGLVTFSHFWMERDGEERYNFKARLVDAGKDLLRVLAAPLSIVALELASIYGWFRPYDGRKLYASIERATYGDYVLAPCFQPDPKLHAFGGDIKKKDEL